jgi:predicted MFS family arabinose efflux permease
MGWVLSMGGLAGVVGGLLLPLISDRVGRVPVCAAACFAGMVAPLMLLLLPGQPVALAMTILLGWIVIGIAPLYCAVIPSESAPDELTTVAIGLSMAAAELIGGVVIPYLCGRAADAWGLAACMVICVLLAFAAGCASLFLVETAPRLRAASATSSSGQGPTK